MIIVVFKGRHSTFSPKDTSSSATFDVLVDNVDSGENLKQYVSDS